MVAEQCLLAHWRGLYINRLTFKLNELQLADFRNFNTHLIATHDSSKEGKFFIYVSIIYFQWSHGPDTSYVRYMLIVGGF